MSAVESTPDNTEIWIRLASGSVLVNTPTRGRDWEQLAANGSPTGVRRSELSINQFITRQLLASPPPVITHRVHGEPHRPGIPSWVR